MEAQHVSSSTPLIIRSSKLYEAEQEKTFFPLSLGNSQSPTTSVYKPEAANTV
jgi:hypothetical protein